MTRHALVSTLSAMLLATSAFAQAATPDAQPAPPDAKTKERPESLIKVFQLRNAQAANVARVINALFDNQLEAITSDERTNSLITAALRQWPREDQEQLLNVIEALIVRLDEPPSAEHSPPTTAEGAGSAGGGSMVGGTSSASLAELKGQYTAKEQAAADLPRLARELQSAPEAHKPMIDELTARLRRAVTDSFAARQRLHQAEAAQLQQRIAGIQQDLQTRQKLSDQIIDRRVKDLLNPDLEWNSSSRESSGASPGASPKTRQTSSTQPPGKNVYNDPVNLSPPLALTIGRSGEPTTFRSADDFRNQLQSLEHSLKRAEKSDQQSVERIRQNLAFLREEYAAQIRLLELEVQSAKGAVESTQQQFQVAYQGVTSGRLTQDNVIAARQAVQEAKLRADRATTLLDLYRKADPKNAISAPSADPSTAVEPASR